MIRFGDLVPEFQPTAGNCSMTPRLLTEYRRAIDGTMIPMGPVRAVRSWRIKAPCGNDLSRILGYLSMPVEFTDVDGVTATVRITSVSEVAQPTPLIGEYEIVLEEVAPYGGSW